MLNIKFNNVKTIDKIIVDYFTKTNTDITVVQIKVAEILQVQNKYILIEYFINGSDLNDCVKQYKNDSYNLNDETLNNVIMFDSINKAKHNLLKIKEYGYYTDVTIFEHYEEFLYDFKGGY